MYRSAVLFCCVFFSALTPYLTHALSDAQKEKIHAHFAELGAMCIENNPITEDDINAFRSKQMGSSPNAPCFLACVMKKIGVMDDTGMLQGENALELAKKVFEDPEEIKNIADYLHSCKSVNDAAVGDGDKGCERSVLAFNCMRDNASKFGFEI